MFEFDKKLTGLPFSVINARALCALLFIFGNIGLISGNVAFAATEIESLAAIRQAAGRFAISRLESVLPDAKPSVKVGQLDTRLKLAACGQKLRLSAPAGSANVGNTVVAVVCPGPVAWKLYVPVRVAARQRVVIAARSLKRGVHLGRADLSMASRNLARLSYGYYTRPDEVIGQVLTRNLIQGRVITPTSLRPPLLVKRGQVVTIKVQEGELSVTAQGEALQNGAQGSLVRVRNVESKRIVQGIVIGFGVVEVGR